MLSYHTKLADIFQKEEDFDKKPLKKYVHCSLILFTVLFITFVFGPTYMAIGVKQVLPFNVPATVTGIVAGISLLFGCAAFLLGRKYKYVEGLFTGLLFLCFINALILPVQAGILDGREELGGLFDNPVPFIRNIVIFIVLAAVSTVFRKQLRFSAVPLVLIVVVFTISNIQTMNTRQAEINENNRDNDKIIESAVTFGSESNTIVIVMDMWQGIVIENTVSQYPYLLDTYDGFTIFTRTVSSFPFSSYSASVIQTGELYTTDDPIWEESHRYTFSSSFMSDMRDRGAKVNILGFVLQGEDQTEFPFIGRMTPNRPWAFYSAATSASLARLTGYRINIPIGNIFHVDTSNWENGELAWSVDKKQEGINTVEFLIDNINTSDEQKKLLYIWSLGTHVPVFISRDGSMDTESPGWYAHTTQRYIDESYYFLNQLARLFNRMKELGVYDNSTIIVVSDHGSVIEADFGWSDWPYIDAFHDGAMRLGSYAPVQMYNSVLMVKPPNSFDRAVVTQDVAWNGDVRELLNRYSEADDSASPVSPVEVMADIRAGSPEIGVMFAPFGLTLPQIKASTEYHEILYIKSLQELPAAFLAHLESRDE